MKYHPDERAKHTLIRAVYVYDRAVWLRNHDNARIDDVLDFLEQMFSGATPPRTGKPRSTPAATCCSCVRWSLPPHSAKS